MRNKLKILILVILCVTFGVLPAMAETVVPPELERFLNQQTEQVVTEVPLELVSDYIDNVTWNLPHHVQKLSNGNLLLCRVGAWDPGVIEVNQQGTEVWYYRGIQANSAQRLENGNTLVADSGAPGAPYIPRVVEFTPDGKVAWEYVLPSVVYAPRYAERLANGNTLVVLPFEVREINPQKQVVWQYGLGKPSKAGMVGYLAHPLKAHRLANGNTMIVDRGYARGRVLEVSPGKKVIWQSSNTSKDSQAPDLIQPLDALRLADGSTLITDKKQDMLFLLDTSGKVMEVRSWASLYKSAPVTNLWFAQPQEDGNVLISTTMVTGRSRIAEVVGESMESVGQ